jgi:plastocyanin
MNSTGVFAVVGGVALVIFALIGAVAVYDAVAHDDMMGGMSGRVDDMGGMMDGGMMGRHRAVGNQTSGTASGQGDVRIIDFEYMPSILEVTPGTVVKWTNEDSAPHTATAKDESFDTGRLDKGASVQITFDSAGTSYDYICTYHTYMKGRIVVSASPS